MAIIPKINPKDLIKTKLPPTSSATLSIPKPTPELSNVESLNSKNLVGNNNTPLPTKIKDQKIAEGVEKNTPGIKACLTQKIKDLAGVFTLPFGIPSFDQFNQPNINDVNPTGVFDNLKNTFKSTVSGIKDMFKFKKQNNLDQVETGGLSLKKFLGCDEANVNFTPRERVQAQKQPAIITNKIEAGTKESQVALADQANRNVQQRTEPPAEKSKQTDVPVITDVENISPIPWDYYNLRIYKTPVAEPLTAENNQMLNNAGLSVDNNLSQTESVPFLKRALEKVLESSYTPLLDLVSEKKNTPDIALYDPLELDQKKTAYNSLPGGYLLVILLVKNDSYSITNNKKTSTNTYTLTSDYKTPGAEQDVQAYKEQIKNIGSGTTYSNTYIRADIVSINSAIKGPNRGEYTNTKPVSPLLRDITSSTFKF